LLALEHDAAQNRPHWWNAGLTVQLAPAALNAAPHDEANVLAYVALFRAFPYTKPNVQN
jgi:hypothetical protein